MFRMGYAFMSIHSLRDRFIYVRVSVTVVELERERASRGVEEVKNIANCRRATLGNWIRSLPRGATHPQLK